MKRRAWLVLLAGGALWGQKKLDDGYIYDQVRMRLANDADVKGGTLDVDVRGGVVTVRGRVNTEKARAKVDKLVKKVKGVSQVFNEVKVEP